MCGIFDTSHIVCMLDVYSMFESTYFYIDDGKLIRSEMMTSIK